MKTNSKQKNALLVVLLSLLIPNVTAQEPKAPTLEDPIPGGATYRPAENLFGLQWWGDECIKPEIKVVFMINPRNGKETLLTIRNIVNKALEAGNHSKLQHFHNVSFPWPKKSLVLISLPDKYIVYDFDYRKIISTRPVPKEDVNRDYQPETGHVAYTIGNNPYIGDKAITNEPQGIVCGQAVHRREFGIKKGTFWNPSGNLLAFYRMDGSMVAQYPLVDITAPIAEVNSIRYPMAGVISHQTKVDIHNPAIGKSIYLNAGDPTDRYFTNISWVPDEKSLYLIELNRDQNHAKLCQHSAETSDLIATLFEGENDKYVEPQKPVIFLPWDSSKFIYQSQKGGLSRLYLHDTSGKQLRQLTEGEWLVKEVLGFDAKKKEITIASTEFSPLQSNLFRVDIETGARTPLGSGEGVHSGKLGPPGRYLVDQYSSPSVPRSINILDVQNDKSVNLLTAADPFAGYKMPSIETGIIRVVDGKTDLYYRPVKPADSDPNKRYPAIIYVYGGPHAQMVTNDWQSGARDWDICMANKGYILFIVDGRGSDNHGLDLGNVTFRQLGIEEGRDQVKGAEFLKSPPYVDGNRIGVHGWSSGGHMTTALLLHYPEVFKVGVAGGPVIGRGYYEVMYNERYMDTPQSNPKGYKEYNLKNLAGSLKGHLMITHDDHDDTYVSQYTLSLMKACIDTRTYPDLLIYPCHKHNVSGRDRVHLHEKITRYFKDCL